MLLRKGRRGGSGRVGDRRGAVGGAVAAAVPFTFGAGGRDRDLPALGTPLRAQGRGRWRKSPRAARRWPEERRPWEPASRPRRPPSPTLLPGCARAPQLCFGGCGGSRRAGWTGPCPRGLAGEEGARRLGPSAQRSGRGCRAVVLRPSGALLAGARDLPALLLLLL